MLQVAGQRELDMATERGSNSWHHGHVALKSDLLLFALHLFKKIEVGMAMGHILLGIDLVDAYHPNNCSLLSEASGLTDPMTTRNWLLWWETDRLMVHF